MTDQDLAAEDVDPALLIESPEQLARCIVNGWIVDGRSGGLVRGRLHSEGHILMIQATGTLGGYKIMGYMEGGEYLMSTEATAIHFERIKEINADNAPLDGELAAALPGRVIDTHAEPHDKLLLIHNQYIVNRRSTLRHFDELVALNAPHAFYKGRIFTDEEIGYMQDKLEV